MEKLNKKDISYAIVKAGISLIPFAGAPASELLSLIVTPPFEKRRESWMNEVGEKLIELEKKTNLDLSSLSSNQLFIDIVLKTSQLALQTSEQEKLQYYKNIVSNSALGVNPDLAETQIFLNMINTFTVWHIKILHLIDNPKEWLTKNGVSLPQGIVSSSLLNLVEWAFPELKDRSEFCNLIWSDLHSSGLHNSGSLQGMMSFDGMMSSKTSGLGKKFIAFIKES